MWIDLSFLNSSFQYKDNLKEGSEQLEQHMWLVPEVNTDFIFMKE